jgi:hypothetical protein
VHQLAILEFATEVDGKQVEGIDKLTFDEDGLITELKVMIRRLRRSSSSERRWPRQRDP